MHRRRDFRAICYEWPGHRQDWTIIHREAGRILLVSEGLSDPFIAKLEPLVGFGLELALETEGTELPLDNIEGSWPYNLLERVSQEGKVGALLGLESRTLPRQFPTPFGDVRLVTVKALVPAELEYVSKRGVEGAAELARRFADTAEEHVSRASRRAAL